MKQERGQKSKLRKEIESVGLALLAAFAIRSFVAEPFRIPSTSMLPTLLVGDFLFVNKFVYGLRIPLTKIRVWQGRDPKRGEVIVFIWPKEEDKDFIKRVVGLPGDTIRVEETDVFVNGEKVSKSMLRLSGAGGDRDFLLAEEPVTDPSQPYQRFTRFPDWDRFQYFRETLGEMDHVIQHAPFSWRRDAQFQVPAGHYFVMGDNRDFSSDSREWGFVPRKNIKGRAMFIWLSWARENRLPKKIRWYRFGNQIR